MKTFKVFNRGKILKSNYYNELKTLDYKVFSGCGDEFKENRDWWVIVSGNQIIAYCGCGYTENICIFVRAWVHKDYRGQGLQKKMIKLRLKSAFDCYIAITYTTDDNYPSANSLISLGFKLYNPEYAYAGRKMLYFQKVLKNIEN
jgi:RimJ/RimL family protein N-acetyltransferase